MGKEFGATAPVTVTENNSGSTTPAVEFSVAIPVHNSAATLEALVQRIGAVFSRLGRSCEIVLVDDGSRDDSWEVIESLHRQGEPLRGVPDERQ